MNEENKKLLEEIGKRFDIKTEEIKRYFDVAVEEMESKIDFLVEGQTAIREKFDTLEVKVDSLEVKVNSLIDDMDYVKSNLVDNRDRFKEIDETTENHEKRLIKLEKLALAKG